MKAFGEERIAGKESSLVVDLGGCTGMDSTFMGTLAGMAARLSTVEGGNLQIADAGPRNRRSLEDLGLDFLIEIDPPDARWQGKLEIIRSKLQVSKAQPACGQEQRTVHVLEAHQILAQTNEENARKFSSVVSLLESELAEERKEK